jgi:hypothetical protein
MAACVPRAFFPTQRAGDTDESECHAGLSPEVTDNVSAFMDS